MSRFQLVFQHADGDRMEMRDATNGEPRIGGVLLIDGAVFQIKDVEWLAKAEKPDADGLVRFTCTLVVAPADANPG